MAVQKPTKKHRTGCLIPLGIYIAVLVIGFFTTRPAPITDDFADRASRKFSIATVRESADGFEYGRQTLEGYLERDPERLAFSYLLPEAKITIQVGDIHQAAIIEDHGDWQLIEFNYSNTYMATSIYRAYTDRIEPVSYQLNSSVGDAMAGMIVTIAALFLYLLAVIINFFRNRRAGKARAEFDNS